MNGVQVRRFLRRYGIDLCRRMPRVVDLMAHHDVDTVLDIGGNVGQTGIHLRRWGYAGRIVSFEPVESAFAQLSAACATDPLWTAFNLGIGERDGTTDINVSAQTVFSSIRPALPILKTFDQQSSYVGRQQMTLRRLDSIYAEHTAGAREVWVKVDTQGYEREVLAGASESLARIRGIQLELSLTPMYEGEATFLELANLLEQKGFRIALVEPVSSDPATQSLLQVDGFFVRD